MVVGEVGELGFRRTGRLRAAVREFFALVFRREKILGMTKVEWVCFSVAMPICVVSGLWLGGVFSGGFSMGSGSGGSAQAAEPAQVPTVIVMSAEDIAKVFQGPYHN